MQDNERKTTVLSHTSVFLGGESGVMYIVGKRTLASFSINSTVRRRVMKEIPHFLSDSFDPTAVQARLYTSVRLVRRRTVVTSIYCITVREKAGEYFNSLQPIC
jgi:hypothetical protein